MASYSDISGTITSGGVAQTIGSTGGDRRGLIIQNISTGDLWFSTIGPAAAAQPSLWLPAGAYWEAPTGSAPTGAISIYGATTGQSFTAREW